MASPVVRANIEVHTRMAAHYNAMEPHFRPENRTKVRKILERLAQECGGGKLLDLGCGTGFIIDLARDLFEEIHGVDVTQAMLDRVDTSSHNVVLHNAVAEALPFADNTFALVTAYSFLHHTEDYWTVLREAARVLKPGGICYVDLEPNRLFWESMASLAGQTSLPAIVAKARASVLETDLRVEQEFGIPQETFRQAEYSKAVLGGIDAGEIERQANSLGFRSCTVRYEWFLGQAEVMHGQSFEEAARIEAYLRSITPVSNSLFKYLQILLVK